jgi:hypothetical protein
LLGREQGGEIETVVEGDTSEPLFRIHEIVAAEGDAGPMELLFGK